MLNAGGSGSGTRGRGRRRRRRRRRRGSSCGITAGAVQCAHALEVDGGIDGTTKAEHPLCDALVLAPARAGPPQHAHHVAVRGGLLLQEG